MRVTDASVPTTWALLHTKLVQAVVRGNLQYIKNSLQGISPSAQRGLVNSRTAMGETLLNCAIQTGNVHIVDLLIHYGADVNLPNDNHITPLMAALVEARSKNSYPPCILHHHYRMIHRLLQAGADPCARDRQRKTVLIREICAVDRTNPMPADVATPVNAYIQLLITCAPSESLLVNAVDCHGKTALHYAIINRDLACVLILIAHHANLNQRDREGRCPLTHALSTRHLGIIQAIAERWPRDYPFYQQPHLLRHIRDREITGNSAALVSLNAKRLDSLREVLRIAIEQPVYVLSTLLKTWKQHMRNLLRILVRYYDRYGETAITHALQQYDLNKTMVLIEMGACVNTPNQTGDTPATQVIAACAHHNQYAEARAHTCLNLLYQAGANLALANRHGDTPLRLALRKCHWYICRDVIHKIQIPLYPTNFPHSQHPPGETLFLYAVAEGNVYLAMQLIQHGADPNTPINRQEELPFLVALRNRQLYMAHVLITCGARIPPTVWQDILPRAIQKKEIHTVLYLMQLGNRPRSAQPSVSPAHHPPP